MSLSKIVKNVIEEQISTNYSSNTATRFLIEGIPYEVLNSVLKLLQGEGVSAGRSTTLPFLVISDSSDKLWAGETNGSGAYTQDQITRARNTPNQGYVMASPKEIGTIGTLEGPAEIRSDILRRVEEKVFESLFPSDSDLAKDLRKAIRTVLSVRFGVKNIPDLLHWKLLNKLSNLSIKGSSRDSVLAILGLPYCPDTGIIGRNQHVKFVKDLARDASSKGIEALFKELKAAVGNLGEKERETENALEDCKENIITNAGSAANWESDPYSYYSPFFITDVNETIPTWWKILDLETWFKLREDSQPRIESLNLKLHGENIIEDCCKTKIYAGKASLIAELSKKDNSNDLILGEWTLRESRVTLDSGMVAQKYDVPAKVHSKPMQVHCHPNGSNKSEKSDKFIQLSNYECGIVVIPAQAKRFTLPSFKSGNCKCSIHFPSTGEYRCKILLAENVTIEKIKGKDIDEDNEGVSATFNWVEEDKGDFKEANFDIRTDTRCTYEITYKINKPGQESSQIVCEIQVTADSEPAKQELTVVDALMREHTSFGGSRPDVTAHRNASLLTQIGAWKLTHKEGYKPGIITLSKLGKSEIKCPQSWDNWIIGTATAHSDPRPSVEKWCPPKGLIESRESIRKQLEKNSGESGVIESIALGKAWSDSKFHDSLVKYCDEFQKWWETDKEAAGWWESILLIEVQDGREILQTEPCCILLSPLHPFRLRWLAKVQGIMEDALLIDQRVPMLESLTKSEYPENFILRKDDRKREFISLGQASWYWALLWSETQVARAALDTNVLDNLTNLGLLTQGYQHTLGKGHIRGILNDCTSLNPAKNSLNIEILGKDKSGLVSRGLLDWYDERTQDINNVAEMTNGKFLADMLEISPLELNISGARETIEPDSSILANYAGRDLGTLNWHSRGTQQNKKQKKDVVIIAAMDPASLDIKSGRSRGARDKAAVVSIRPMWFSATVLEQPIETFSFEESSAEAGKAAVYIMDTSIVKKALEQGKLVALPSDIIHPANVPHLLGSTGLVWKVKYPDYGASAVSGQGYLVLSEIGNKLMDNIKKLLVDLAGTELNICDQHISSLLVEYGQRGFNSLHQTADRSVSARASLSMLAAVKVLQPSDGKPKILPRNCNVDGGGGFIIPLDPFEAKLAHLWKSVDPKNKVRPRPDLIAVAVMPDKNIGGLRVKLTPIEIKCHTRELNINDRAEILARQCRLFANLLKKLFIDLPKKAQAWNVGARLLLVELVTAGARINAHGSAKWQEEEGARKLSTLLAGLMGPVFIQIGDEGRLVVVDGSRESSWKDQDSDLNTTGFTETLQLDRRQVAKFLNGQAQEFPKRTDNWKLLPDCGERLPNISWEPSNTLQLHESAKPVEIKKNGCKNAQQIKTSNNREKESDKPLDGRVNDKPKSTAISTNSRATQFPQPKISLGKSDSDEKVYWTPYGADSLPERLNNGHVMIVGSSGSGKTFLLKSVIAPQISQYKIPTLYIDFNDDFTQKDFLGVVDAELIRADKGLPINPLALEKSLQDDEFLLMNHIYELKDIFQKAFDLGEQQANNFKDALHETYKEIGLHDRTLKQAPETWPTFRDFKKHLDAKGDLKLINRVSSIFDLEIFTGKEGGMDKRLKESTVLALSLLPSDMVRKAVSDLFLKTTYQYLIRSGHADGIKLAIVIDEAHKITNLPSTSLLLKEGRKYGASLWVSSQEPKDFSNSVKNNCGTQIIFRVDEVRNAEDSAKQLGQRNLAADVRSLSVGTCFLRNLHYAPYTRLRVER